MKKWIISMLALYYLGVHNGYLGVHNGYLALFDSSQMQPMLILPYRAEIFPEADRNILKNGIPFDTQEELTGLLEDFLS